MTANMPSLRRAGHNDIDTVAGLINAAFFDDKVIGFLVPDPQRRGPVSQAWFDIFVRNAIDGHGQVVMTEDASACAVWLDHTAPAEEPEHYDARLAELAGADLPQFQRLDKLMGDNHPHDPHWYLMLLAVLPDRQGEGLGSLLLEHTHTGLDKNGHAAYLEATSVRNKKLYERHGYEAMDSPTIGVDGDIVLHRMWRPVLFQ